MQTIKIKILLFFYGSSINITFFLRLVFLLITFRFKEFKKIIHNNLGFYNKVKQVKCAAKSSNNKFIWFHAASVGESLLVFPLVKELLQKNVNYPILVTSCTESSRNLWHKEFKEKIIHCYLPWDLKIFAKFFIKCVKPKLAIFVEADFWPNFLFTLKQNKIPTLLFNGRISRKSFKRWRHVRFFITELLKIFSFVGAGSLKSQKYIEHFLGKGKVSYFGSLKYTAEGARVNLDKLQQILTATAEKVILLAISTHKPEEVMLAQIHIELKKTIPNLLTIIIPRHIERKKSILKDLQQFPLEIQFFSKNKVPKDCDIYVIDVFAKTALFCEIAKIAYIGKSMFKEASGGHNLLEPMKKGVVTLFGPYMTNFKEISELALQKNAAMQFNSPKELQNAIQSLLSNSSKLQIMGDNAKKLAIAKTKVKDEYFEIINKFLAG